MRDWGRGRTKFHYFPLMDHKSWVLCSPNYLLISILHGKLVLGLCHARADVYVGPPGIRESLGYFPEFTLTERLNILNFRSVCGFRW